MVENEKHKKIHCSATGIPEPSFSWKFGNHQIMKGPLLHYPTGALRKNAGTYTCQSINQHGVKEIFMKLDVLFKPKCKIHQLMRNEKVLLKCEATGNPGNISHGWRKDNLSVLRENTYDEDSSMLEIRLERRNEGMYFCDPRNSVGLGNPCRIYVSIPVASSSFLSSSDTIVLLAVSSVLVMVMAVSVAVISCKRYRKTGKEYCVSSQEVRK